MSRLRSARLSRAAILSLAFAPSLMTAQTSAVLDEGTLMVSRNGAPIGRESFRIIRAAGAGGQVYQSNSSTALGTRRITSQLGTDSTGLPVSYESYVFDANVQTEHVSGRGRPGRFSVLVRTRTGESAREYVLTNGALLVDEAVFHHYYFLALAGGHQRFNVIEARSQRQTDFGFAERGSEVLEIGGRKIESRHLALTADASSLDVWVDRQGRLLKVSIPADGLVALRDDPPRN
jgi:hypothetical protein